MVLWCVTTDCSNTHEDGVSLSRPKRPQDAEDMDSNLYFELDLFETGSTTSLWASARDEEDRCLVQYQLTLKKPLRDRHAVVDGQTAKKRRVALEKGRKLLEDTLTAASGWTIDDDADAEDYVVHQQNL